MVPLNIWEAQTPRFSWACQQPKLNSRSPVVPYKFRYHTGHLGEKTSRKEHGSVNQMPRYFRDDLAHVNGKAVCNLSVSEAGIWMGSISDFALLILKLESVPNCWSSLRDQFAPHKCLVTFVDNLLLTPSIVFSLK